ncbi:MAG TPA: PAS domain-containing protein, partial [Gemmatimonadaceae bacterium]|nr:PAS domain-containing protein [Gemmatimonadaceae bacterium]
MASRTPRMDSDSLLNDFADALIAVSVEGRILFWSRGAEEMFGFSRDEVLGRLLAETVSREN